jgi:hypothetical protein
VTLGALKVYFCQGAALPVNARIKRLLWNSPSLSEPKENPHFTSPLPLRLIDTSNNITTMEACYSMHKGIISKNVAVIPCGITNTTNPHVTCCVRGDWCMSDSICHFNNTDGDSGYYRADCTDPTLQDPACATRCGESCPSPTRECENDEPRERV